MMSPDYEYEPVILTRFDKMKKAADFLQTSLLKKEMEEVKDVRG